MNRLAQLCRDYPSLEKICRTPDLRARLMAVMEDARAGRPVEGAVESLYRDLDLDSSLRGGMPKLPGTPGAVASVTIFLCPREEPCDRVGERRAGVEPYCVVAQANLLRHRRAQ